MKEREGDTEREREDFGIHKNISYAPPPPQQAKVYKLCLDQERCFKACSDLADLKTLGGG